MWLWCYWRWKDGEGDGKSLKVLKGEGWLIGGDMDIVFGIGVYFFFILLFWWCFFNFSFLGVFYCFLVFCMVFLLVFWIVLYGLFVKCFGDLLILNGVVIDLFFMFIRCFC